MMTYAAHVTSEATGVPLKKLLGNSRQRDIARARFAFMAAVRERGKSLPQIGLFLGYDHTSILHGVRRAAELERDCPDFAAVMQTLREEVVAR